jgi:hypothetical protein|tara:strand:+ start:478 stop:675 length:198 start_codon:yes stop_codon:yes gene_type:complete
VQNATLLHIVAVSGGVKISGRAPKITDFLPESSRPTKDPALSEARLMVALEAMAAAQKPNNPKDK